MASAGPSRVNPVYELESHVELGDLQKISDYYESHEDGQGQGIKQNSYTALDGAGAGKRVYLPQGPNAASGSQGSRNNRNDYYTGKPFWAKLYAGFIPALPDDYGHGQAAQQ